MLGNALRIVVVTASITTVAFASDQSPNALTNADVIDMVAAKLSDQVIVTAIQISTSRKFDVTPAGLIALKKAGVSDLVVSAMQTAAAENGQPSAKAASENGRSSSLPLTPSPALASEAGRSGAIDEPKESNQVYRIDATGRLVPLEWQKTDIAHGGVAGNLAYLKGATSPVVISAHDGQLRFIVRLQSKTSYWPKYMADIQKKPWKINALTVD